MALVFRQKSVSHRVQCSGFIYSGTFLLPKSLSLLTLSATNKKGQKQLMSPGPFLLQHKMVFLFLFKLQIISCVTCYQELIMDQGRIFWYFSGVSEAHAFITRKPRFLFCNYFFLFVCIALRNVTSLSCELSYLCFEFSTSNMTCFFFF